MNLHGSAAALCGIGSPVGKIPPRCWRWKALEGMSTAAAAFSWR